MVPIEAPMKIAILEARTLVYLPFNVSSSSILRNLGT
ncbi:hypothetical protein SAMN04490185_3478 [Pseudomonas frederiksbergensis]|uniref:Uncharacterized protein n=1 Tax=Pseudomonas frederiksbergensis TaxID=104087 RepID=A0A1H5AMS1_9PSED|nr:hypothetical protein SAMN04490185_3478 [Pseudomonas frederiksbergensis]